MEGQTLEQVTKEAIEKFHDDREAASWIRESYPEIWQQNERILAIERMKINVEIMEIAALRQLKNESEFKIYVRRAIAAEQERATPIATGQMFVARRRTWAPVIGGCIICSRWPERGIGDIEMFIPNTSEKDDRFICNDCAIIADADQFHSAYECEELFGIPIIAGEDREPVSPAERPGATTDRVNIADLPQTFVGELEHQVRQTLKASSDELVREVDGVEFAQADYSVGAEVILVRAFFHARVPNPPDDSNSDDDEDVAVKIPGDETSVEW